MYAILRTASIRMNTDRAALIMCRPGDIAGKPTNIQKTGSLPCDELHQSKNLKIVT
jgi:hypothetical protein